MMLTAYLVHPSQPNSEGVIVPALFYMTISL